jgi:hypothetical protein
VTGTWSFALAERLPYLWTVNRMTAKTLMPGSIQAFSHCPF